MRTISEMAAAGLAAMLVVPASAQTQLAERDLEFYAEMLAMGEVCDEMSFGVRRDALADWVADQLSGGTEDDLDAVVNRRDVKIASLKAEADELKEMTHARGREAATNDFYGAISTRCRRMLANEISEPFFGS